MKRNESEAMDPDGIGELMDRLGEFGPYIPWDRLRQQYADDLNRLRSVLDALQSRIRELEAEPRYLAAEWIDARENPPRPGQEFLGYYKAGKYIFTNIVSTRKNGLPVHDDYLWDVSGNKIGKDVTHWMPLPKKPK